MVEVQRLFLHLFPSLIPIVLGGESVAGVIRRGCGRMGGRAFHLGYYMQSMTVMEFA